jgi:glutathione synthase/RimK-type ligase-like ATP-grasp enzyme
MQDWRAAGREPRVALLTSRQWPNGNPDDAALASVCADAGIHALWRSWDDQSLDPRAFDACLVRSCWDYTERCRAFLDVLASAAKHTQLLNPLPLLRWNADKRYLFALEGAGIEVVPTLLWDPRDAASPTPRSLARTAARRGFDLCVVKPAISAGACDTVRVAVDQLAAHLDALRSSMASAGKSRDSVWLVQPYLPGIEQTGEWSLVFFDGVPSHAVLKRPGVGDFRVQPHHGGHTESAHAPPALWSTAHRVIEALRIVVPAAGDRPPLYCRVDGIVSNERLVLMEIELIEPMLFLAHDAGAARRLAIGLARRIREASPRR